MKVTNILKNKSFFGLFVSQATGAFNDNALKMILVGVVLAVKPVLEHDSYLALINALLILPFVLLTPVVGWFSDRFSKRSVLLTFKWTEFLILGLLLLAIFTESIWVLFLFLFLMGAQSAFYSPAKYGILKEIVPERRLGQANGIIEMGCILAIIIGTVGGAFLYDVFKTPTGNGGLIPPLILLALFSLIGLIFTFRIDRVPPSTSDVMKMKDFFHNLSELKNNRVLRLTVAGICYFWFTAMLLNLLLILFGTQTMGLSTVSEASILFLYLCLGVAFGSYLAAKASRYKVELGLIPAGSIGVGITTILLPWAALNYHLVVFDLLLLGICSGIFLVPLNTLLQIESGDEKRGRFIAIANMFTNLGMLLSSAALFFLSSSLQLAPPQIFFVLGLFSFGVSVYIFNLLPEAFFSLFLGILTHIIYRIKSINPERIPESGGVLLTPNHMSFIDGLILQCSIPHRKVRFLVDRSYCNKPIVGWFLRIAGCIPVSEKGAKNAIIKAAEALKDGEVVCIFPEGSITRIGFLLPFKRGIELILKKASENIVVIPVYFDKLWGSIFSFKGEKFIWKKPEKLPYPVTVLFGKRMQKSVTAFELRQKVSGLSSKAFSLRTNEYKTLPNYFIKTAKRYLFRKSIVDITGKSFTYLKLLTSSILFSREIKKKCHGDEMVGIMLPASVAGVISNVAIGLAGKTSVNLNFKAGRDAVSKSIARCEIKTIITSKRFVQKTGLNTLREFVYVEDLAKKAKLAAKISVLASVLLFPTSLLTALYYRKGSSQDDIATVIFSSGSTGDPKGVMLSHANIISNQEMASQVLHHRSDDRILGSLPFFHSFGYTMTLWFPLLKGIFTAYVPNPLDAKKVGAMAGKYQTTIMFGTPTFYHLYTRECKPEQFNHIRLAIAGAERLPKGVAESFGKKFGCFLIEGYGVTEMAPIISCNVPDFIKKGIVQKGRKAGSVGITLPGVSAKIVDLDNYDLELSSGKEGMLLVKGPNRMMGYLKDENRTKEVLHKDWYITGDMAKTDDDGFIYIVGRFSRFSKIGGEMVPHIQIEDTISKTLGFEEQRLIVTSVKDNARGEKLVVLYLPEVSSHINRREIKGKLRNAGLPNLWIPKDFYEVEKFPLLASGKLDLKALGILAQGFEMGKKTDKVRIGT